MKLLALYILLLLIGIMFWPHLLWGAPVLLALIVLRFIWQLVKVASAI